MFARLIFQTKEIGTIVIYRLPPEHGGIGDITVSRDGVVLTGNFDLRTPEAQKAFAKTYRQALRQVPVLREEKLPLPDPDEITKDWATAHVFSTIFQTRMTGAPLRVGKHLLRPDGDFSTVVHRADAEGNWKYYCCLCRCSLRAGDEGRAIPKKDVKSQGLYGRFKEKPGLPLVIESRSPPIWMKLDTDISGILRNYAWVHNCSVIDSQEVRTTFQPPPLVPRREGDPK